MSLAWALLTALLAALMMLLVVGGWLVLWVRPRMMRDLRELLRTQADEAATRIATEVEEAVRRGLVEGVTSLPTREVIQGTTRAVARTSVELVEERLGLWFGRRRPPRQEG